MSLTITDRCIGCTFCQNECPVVAITYNGMGYEINNDICIRCGHCSEICLMDAIQDSEHPHREIPPHDTIRKTCDFVVVGGGAAGLVAAARYAELTGKKVIVLEKNRRVGGGGYFAVGLTPCNTQWEKDVGIPDCVDKKVQEAMERTDGKLNPELLKNLYTSLGTVFDWLCQWAPVDKCFTLQPHPFTGELTVGNKSESYGSGKFITTHIIPYLEKLGVEILTETEAVALHRGSTGQITGVTAKDAGGIIEIECQQCLLCTGSLIRSERIKAMLPDFADTVAKQYAHDMPGLTGDGLTLAENAGVSLNTDSIVLAFVGCMAVSFDKTVFQTAERGDILRINLEGRRWCNEAESRQLLAEHLMDQPKSISYTILDSSILESPNPDVQPGREPMYPGGVPDFAVPRGEITPATGEAFKALADRLHGNTFVCADTIGELAEKLSIPVAALEETVSRYNEACKAGIDSQFGKDAAHLKPMEKGPFFAIHNYLYLDGVFGGLDISPNMEVVSDGAIVPGLYAAGDITCGRYVNDLKHKREIINDYSWAIAGGFMAANQAAKGL